MMKPTLCVEDLKGWDYVVAQHVDRFERILPTRCPDFFEDIHYGMGDDCECEGRGWSYPDMPDWWYEPAEWERETPWKAFCKDMWRTMGILEDTP